ncbi:hypothetical protein BST81_04300 [Leptolyngbya sp. 'hensonii']|uniref:tetratricopeptide repeat protein n=1 Tax=Leptolyngbya sp. 'hensonii' TaxID=1922337 RepID=UPI00094F7F2C|nr:tetratricopeptide repeat protein [Leptolyngbya sp. 'hensonii']OLP19761.1 hypothetical protein BST81_04300 [Leptolyngbya sp. 'hensonii']
MKCPEFEQAFKNLPPRRRDVLLRMLKGETDAEIAQALGIGESTVRKYIERIGQDFELGGDGTGERRSRRTEIVTLVAQHKPELLNESQSQPDLLPRSVNSENKGLFEASFIQLVLKQPKEDLATVLQQLLANSSPQKQKKEFANVLNELGHQIYMNGDIRSATFYLEFAVQFNPELPSAHFNLGSAYEKLGHKEEARQHYTIVASQTNVPEDEEHAVYAAINNLARLHILQGEEDQAIDLILPRLEQILPRLAHLGDRAVRSALHKNLGWAYLYKGNYLEAGKYLLKAIELDGNRPDAHCLLAKVHTAQGNYQAAIASWKNCRELGDNLSMAYRFPELDLWQSEAHAHLKSSP